MQLLGSAWVLDFSQWCVCVCVGSEPCNKECETFLSVFAQTAHGGRQQHVYAVMCNSTDISSVMPAAVVPSLEHAGAISLVITSGQNQCALVICTTSTHLCQLKLRILDIKQHARLQHTCNKPLHLHALRRWIFKTPLAEALHVTIAPVKTCCLAVNTATVAVCRSRILAHRSKIYLPL